MSNATKATLFILFVINMIVCYRVNRNLSIRMNDVIWTHGHTPSKSIKAIKVFEDRVTLLESKMYKVEQHQKLCTENRHGN